MTDQIVPVILSGGAGTRLWPMSTSDRPKQFLPLASDASLFAETLMRVADAARFTPPVIVGNSAHIDHVVADLGAMAKTATLIFEPVARNTAPAIALAAHAVSSEHGPESLMLVMPSDHVMSDPQAFLAAVDQAAVAARAGRLVTFGITPDSPQTGFGYLALGDALDASPGVHGVARFIEKPPLADAEAMLANGGHLWNAGIFLFRADVLLSELELHAPEIAASVSSAALAARREGRQFSPDATHFAASPSDSIDYALMERSGQVATVPMNPGWSDVGSWDALCEMGLCDEAGNRLRGDIVAIDVENCLIRSDGVEIAALGISDLIIVASGGKLLILPRGRSQEVKRLIEARKAK